MTRASIKDICEDGTEGRGSAKVESQCSADSTPYEAKSSPSSADVADAAPKPEGSEGISSVPSSEQTDDSVTNEAPDCSSADHREAPITLQQVDAAVITRFDLDATYGPASGIARLVRWDRAETFGLSPPISVRETLVKLAENETNIDKTRLR